MSSNADLIAIISQCDDEQKLRNWIENASKRGATDVADAAFKRLVAILPQEEPGSLEWDFWRTIHAFELILSNERERTMRLSRTRQKVGRVGVVQTLIDWALDDKETKGFAMLFERNMLDLTGEAIILRHPTRFEVPVRDAAARRLERAAATAM
jgi:hypothetical protein